MPIQKIRSTAYTNFSVLGLSITLIIGGLIIVLAYTLEHIIAFIERRHSKIKYSRLEWSANDILQTQRMAHEAIGDGTWANCAGVDAVPVTEKPQSLAGLDIRDPDHPRLEVPSTFAAGDSNSVGEAGLSSTTQTVSNGGSTFAEGSAGGSAESTTINDERPYPVNGTQEANPVGGEEQNHNELPRREESDTVGEVRLPGGAGNKTPASHDKHLSPGESDDGSAAAGGEATCDSTQRPTEGVENSHDEA